MANGENSALILHRVSRDSGLFLMIRFQFSQFKGTITQGLIVLKNIEIDDFWTLDMSVPTLDMLLSTITQTRMGSVIFQEMAGVRGGHPILFFKSHQNFFQVTPFGAR